MFYSGATLRCSSTGSVAPESFLLFALSEVLTRAFARRAYHLITLQDDNKPEFGFFRLNNWLQQFQALMSLTSGCWCGAVTRLDPTCQVAANSSFVYNLAKTFCVWKCLFGRFIHFDTVCNLIHDRLSCTRTQITLKNTLKKPFQSFIPI